MAEKLLDGGFEMKSVIVGTDPTDVQEAKILNRVIRVSKEGWFLEADQRHAELIIRELSLEGANGVGTPGEDDKPWKEQEEAEMLTGGDATRFRGIAARANYLALDRPDIQYAVKETCRGMANPTRGDLRRLRRIGRYLIDKPRLIFEYKYQGECWELDGYSDSDWAGCRRTAKSTSGGAIMRGAHCLKTWSSTQKNITLSSGEAELVAAVKMSCELIGICQLASEWGNEHHGNVHVDSSAALGMVGRKGNGKMRHINVGLLWIQEKSEAEELSYKKVLGTENIGDLMTKHLPISTIKKLIDIMGLEFKEGRASTALKV